MNLNKLIDSVGSAVECATKRLEFNLPIGPMFSVFGLSHKDSVDSILLDKESARKGRTDIISAWGDLTNLARFADKVFSALGIRRGTVHPRDDDGCLVWWVLPAGITDEQIREIIGDEYFGGWSCGPHDYDCCGRSSASPAKIRRGRKVTVVTSYSWLCI